jgi:hypothetical protein
MSGPTLFPNVCNDAAGAAVNVYADANYYRCVETAQLISKAMQYQCGSYVASATPVKDTGAKGQFVGEGSIYRLLVRAVVSLFA